MRMDYFNLLVTKGFLISNDITEDEITNLKLMISSVTNGMKILSTSSNQIFCIDEKLENYQISVGEDYIECTSQMFKNNSRLSTSEFSVIKKQDDGNYVFTRVKPYKDGLIIETSPITGPDKNSIYITGYDKNTMSILEDFTMSNLLSISYQDIVSLIEQEKSILPDMQRKITMSNQEKDIIVTEEDLITDVPYVIAKTNLGEHEGIPSYVVLANYVKTRDFHKELQQLDGLSASLESDIEKIKILDLPLQDNE